MGSRLLRDLPTALPGVKFKVLDNLQRATQGALLGLPGAGSFEFVEGDVLDGGLLRSALRGVEAVVHLAAVVRSPMSFENPTWLGQVNHWGTARLAEECLRAGVKRLVYASSAAVYGPGGPFDEESVPRPVGPYGTSKRQAEESLFTAAERGLAVTVLRLGTLHGLSTAMRFDGFVNRLALLAGTRRSLPVHGTGEQRRPSLHVADASRAMLLALLREDLPQTLNIASENPSVNDIVLSLRELVPALNVRHVDQDVLTRFSFELDSRAALAAGWRPAVSVSDSLKEMLSSFGDAFTRSARDEER